VIGEGERRAARHLACRLGCTACSIGPLDITALDAARPARGRGLLAGDDPTAARAVCTRARDQWRVMAAEFPGDVRIGILGAAEAIVRSVLALAGGRLSLNKASEGSNFSAS
jgi:hypothetical protein